MDSARATANAVGVKIKLEIKEEGSDNDNAGTGIIDDNNFQKQEYQEEEGPSEVNNNNDDKGILSHKDMKLLFGLSKSRRLCYPKPLLVENRRRLGRLLSELARAHNWKEASGVLSVLLKGTPRGTSFSEEHRKFLAAMEIQKRLGDQRNYRTKIKKTYEVWMSKLAWLKKSGRKRYSIHLELALFYLSHGSIQEAFNATKFLIKDNDSASEPIVNLIHGLILYQMWYSGLPDDMQIKDSYVHMFSESYGTTSNEGQELFESSDEHNAIDIEVVNYSSTFASESSVGNEKNMLEDSKNEVKRQSTDVNMTHKLSISASEMNEGEPSSLHQHSKYSIFFAHGMEKSLLPIQLNQLSGDLNHTIYSYRRLANENYSDAVKHLKFALHSTPPLLAALMPLIQILLLGDHVEEALMELEKSCHCFDAALPFRLKARILECFNSTQVALVSGCYEEALKRDPTCNISLMRLIEMHKNGTYNTMPLFEVITSHLDAVDGRSIIWDEFASCFLKLASSSASNYDDCISANVKGATSVFLHSTRVPTGFTEGHMRESWKVRCRWWVARHFNKNAFLKEMQLGDCKLIASKAACACHIYGPNLEYVKAAFSSLKKEGNEDQITLLQKHMENSMSLHAILEGFS